MKDTFQKIITFLKTLSPTKRTVLILSIATSLAVAAICLTSCGSTTKVLARTNDNGAVTITVTAPSTTTSTTDVKPNINLNLKEHEN